MKSIDTKSYESIRQGNIFSFVEKVFSVLIVLVPATFPFHVKLSAFLVVLTLALWLILKPFKNIIASLASRPVTLFIAVLFVMPVMTLLYSDNKIFSLVDKRFWLLMIPVIIFSTTIDAVRLKQILFSFVIGCTSAAAYSLIQALGDPSLMSSEMTSHTIGISHVYFGMYLCLALVILVFYAFQEKALSYLHVVYITWITFLLIVLFIIASRMAIISLIALFIITLVIFVIKTRKFLPALLALVFLTGIFLLVMHNSENSLNRILFLFNREYYQVGDNFWNNVGSRLSMMKCISHVIAENPIFGTGLGDVESDLKTCNHQVGYLSLVQMNAHNQYLQILLGTGVFGLSLFIYFIVFSLKKGYQQGNVLFLCFLFIFLMCGLTESLLERQYGIMFFAFFYSLLFFKGHNMKEEEGSP